ncbi:hypothetical protein [Arcticibacter sp. MXS-1]|uniref:hypothetical protein n=1 Tax=Arcticibacter sp. MXS-1 TaxID=3341726 RepID=UPI0035A937DF
MKTLKASFLLILLLVSIHSHAQSEKFKTAMTKGLEQMKSVKTPDDFIAAANHFDRISAVEKKEWLPSYYASYCNLTAALMTASKESKDLYLDKALAQVSHADSIEQNNSEIYTLKGYVEFMKMAVDPMSRMDFMKKANASLERAIALNPENPRPYLVQGQNVFYTPAAFGGGKDAAKPVLEKAVAKFATFKPVNAWSPDWGKERAETLLAECRK